jgi:hypothetical protein
MNIHVLDTLKTRTICFFEMVVPSYQSIRCHHPENQSRKLLAHRPDTRISYAVL